MSVVISLVVAMCATSPNISTDQVKAKVAELERQNPGAKINVRLDTKCRVAKTKDAPVS